MHEAQCLGNNNLIIIIISSYSSSHNQEILSFVIKIHQAYSLQLHTHNVGNLQKGILQGSQIPDTHLLSWLQEQTISTRIIGRYVAKSFQKYIDTIT